MYVTTPSRAAYTLVPLGAARSSPPCIDVLPLIGLMRTPKGLVSLKLLRGKRNRAGFKKNERSFGVKLSPGINLNCSLPPFGRLMVTSAPSSPSLLEKTRRSKSDDGSLGTKIPGIDGSKTGLSGESGIILLQRFNVTRAS